MFEEVVIRRTNTWLNTHLLNDQNIQDILCKWEQNMWLKSNRGLPWGFSGKESACQCRRHGSNPWSGKSPHVMEQVSLCTTTTVSVLQSPEATTTEAHSPWSPCSITREASAMTDQCTATRETPLLAATEKKNPCSSEDPAQPKINNLKKNK